MLWPKAIMLLSILDWKAIIIQDAHYEIFTEILLYLYIKLYFYAYKMLLNNIYEYDMYDSIKLFKITLCFIYIISLEDLNMQREPRKITNMQKS